MDINKGMIYYFASKNDDLKGLIPLNSIGKTKNQHCHKTIKEAVIYMINPKIINAKRADINEIIKNTDCNIGCYIYKCELKSEDNSAYNKTEFCKITSKEKIENVKDFLLNL